MENFQNFNANGENKGILQKLYLKLKKKNF